MKTAIAALLLTLSISYADLRAQNDNILGFYDDVYGTDCSVYDTGPQLIFVYVVHTTPGATSVLFDATPPPCWHAIKVQIDGNCGLLGCSWDNLNLLYPGCVSGTVHVATLSFFSDGTTPGCCEYWPAPAATALSGQIEAIDCGASTVTADAWPVTANPDGSCECEQPTPVETTTWGRVKALYGAGD